MNEHWRPEIASRAPSKADLQPGELSCVRFHEVRFTMEVQGEFYCKFPPNHWFHPMKLF